MSRHTGLFRNISVSYRTFRNWLRKRSDLDRFLINGGLLFFIYWMLKILFRKTTLLKPVFLAVKNGLTVVILQSGHWLLSLAGYQSFINDKVINIEGAIGVKVTNTCLGWALMALFAGFIIVYPAQLKPKWWFIPAGILLIIALNILRITGMALIAYHASQLLDFYHKYIFKVIIFILIFLLWVIFIKKFGKKSYQES